MHIRVHLASSQVFDDSTLNRRLYFISSFQFAGSFSRPAYDATLLLAKSIGQARVVCLDPADPAVLMSSARSVPFIGASGDVAFSATSNERVLSLGLGSPAPRYEVHNVIGISTRLVRYSSEFEFTHVIFTILNSLSGRLCQSERSFVFC